MFQSLAYSTDACGLTTERSRFWRPLDRSVLDILCGDVVTRAAGPHAHEMVQLLLPVSPLAVVEATGRELIVDPGTVHVTTPGELTGTRSLDGAPVAYRVILCGVGEISRAAPDFSIPTGAIVDARLAADLKGIFAELRKPVLSLEIASRFRAALARLIRRPTSSSDFVAAHPALNRARDYLRQHVTEPVSLDEVARVAFLSKFHLLRTFAAVYGLSPRAYQMELRLARARRLIDEGVSPSRVAHDAGFADQSHLTRRFRSFYGLTPGTYARQLVSHGIGSTSLTAA